MKSIFSKQLIKSLIIILLLLLLIVVTARYLIVETAEDVNLQDQQFLNEISMQNANIVERTVQVNIDKLEAISNIIGNQEMIGSSEAIKYLSLECKRSNYVRMGFAFPNGDAITTDGQNINIADREYFQKTMNGKSSISDKISDIVDGEYINVYSVPLYHQNEIIGVIFATNKTSDFANILNSEIFGSNGYSYIITSDGAPVIYNDHKNTSHGITNFVENITCPKENISSMKLDIKNSANGIICYTLNDIEYIAAYSKIGVNDWYMVSTVSKAVISENTNRLIFRNTTSVVVTAISFTLIIISIAIKNRKTRKKLEQIAYYDSLTGAPNVSKFKLDAEKFINDNPDKKLLLVKFDINQFKLINQILGNNVGNEVLRNIVKTLQLSLPAKSAIYARIHDDEFLILNSYDSPEEMVDARVKFLLKFYSLMGSDFTYYVKLVSGHYFIPYEKREDISIAIEKANIAHRKAKQLEQEICVFDEEFESHLIKQKDIENKMRFALQAGEFRVYLQPKYLLHNETIVGAEALVRWQKPDGSIIFPGEFIPLFEQNGFIISLDMYMFESVCKLIKGWIDNNLPIVTISINFSRLHLLDPYFIDKLVQIKNQYDVPRKYVEIELTESVIFENEELLSNVISKLHQFEFTLSMDDFGTGYSSLGLLKNLPVDAIKIDRSFFVNDIDKQRSKAVIESVMSMAKKLQICTVAEGVEKKDQIDLLNEVGCDIVQGFYYSKPITVEEFLKLFHANR